MSHAGCRRRWLLLLLLSGCGAKSHTILEGDGGPGTNEDADTARALNLSIPAHCDDDDSMVPNSLECTGLFENIAEDDKVLSKAVRGYAPAFPLWSDNAEKHRWIYLPPGQQIDTSDPDAWRLPVGTRVWKEFRVGGKRVETRFFWKVRSDRWVRTTYAWNAEETAAKQHFGGDIQVAGAPYHLPEPGECDDCHDGQPDHVLGFSAVSLGLDGAEGITLAQLADEGWLTDVPSNTRLSIGADDTGLDDDGVPLAAKALGTFHTNCGLTCHNQTPGATANLTNQNLRLDFAVLDGRKPDTSFNVIRTAVGKAAMGAQWGGGHTRIVPGDPDKSLVTQLMGYRNPAGKGAGQMPPIASRVVDAQGLAIVRKWISRLPGGQVDAGGADAGGADAGGADAGGPSSPMDAGSMSAEGMDAGVMDSGTPDAADVSDANAADPDVDAADSSAVADASDSAIEAGDDSAVADAATAGGDLPDGSLPSQ